MTPLELASCIWMVILSGLVVFAIWNSVRKQHYNGYGLGACHADILSLKDKYINQSKTLMHHETDIDHQKQRLDSHLEMLRTHTKRLEMLESDAELRAKQITQLRDTIKEYNNELIRINNKLTISSMDSQLIIDQGNILSTRLDNIQDEGTKLASLYDTLDTRTKIMQQNILTGANDNGELRSQFIDHSKVYTEDYNRLSVRINGVKDTQSIIREDLDNLQETIFES